MRTQELETRDAGRFAWFAQRDASLRSAVNSSLYTDQQKLRAQRLRVALEMCVRAEGIYLEYRKRFITVKVNRPLHINRRDLAILENGWEQEGIAKVVSNQGFTYRLFAQ